MLTHAKIVIRAPDGHFLLAVLGVAHCLGELPRLAFEIGKDAIAAFLMQAVERVLEKCFEFHLSLQNSPTVLFGIIPAVNPRPRNSSIPRRNNASICGETHTMSV